MNKRSHIYKKADSSASNPVLSQFQSRPFIAQAKPQSQKPLTQTETKNQEFQQQKFEATRLKLQAKYGTITPEGQEQLTVLQAKMSGSLHKRLQDASSNGRNFANIPISRPDASSQQAVQRQLISEPSEMHQENKTGLPDNLKAGTENLSGISMDDVKVHYNSPKPAQLQALAYAQGTDIHVAPGQEKHLGHEAWHIVQQKQGRVKPTMQVKGVAINDDTSLEREADVMGAKAVSRHAHQLRRVVQQNGGAMQRVQKQAMYPPSLSCRGDKLLQRSAAHFVTHPLPSCGNVMGYAVATSLTEGTIQRTTKYITDFVKDESGQIDEDYFDKPGDQYTVIDDNFDDEYKSRLTQPTSESTVKSEVQKQSDTEVVLWRGTSTQRALAIESNSSAGGIAVNSQVTAPGRSDAQNQVARGGTFPEYTTDTGVASSFSFRRALVVISIQAKYLTRGSSSESGWIADSAAPIDVLQIVNRTLGLKELKTANASQ
ncbi:hypothetical protein B7486_50785 [cyanobacterium TDX16]|nr:hypothetical protein B7486_50785 [cyanobacterium TDX16]